MADAGYSVLSKIADSFEESERLTAVRVLVLQEFRQRIDPLKLKGTGILKVFD